jgi:hypothetical protein
MSPLCCQCLAGGEPAVIMGIREQPQLKHPIPLCCLPRMRLDHVFIQWCKRLTLQFVFIKPLTAIISLTFMIAGLYDTDAWQYTLLVVYNLSYTAALYSLLLFYMATKILLKGFSPVGASLCVCVCVCVCVYARNRRRAFTGNNNRTRCLGHSYGSLCTSVQV